MFLFSNLHFSNFKKEIFNFWICKQEILKLNVLLYNSNIKIIFLNKSNGSKNKFLRTTWKGSYTSWKFARFSKIKFRHSESCIFSSLNSANKSFEFSRENASTFLKMGSNNSSFLAVGSKHGSFSENSKILTLYWEKRSENFRRIFGSA